MVKRIITGLVLIGILVTALILGGWYFAVPFMAFLGIAIYEVYRALRETGTRLVTWPVYLFFILCIPLLMTKTGGGGALLTMAFGACLFVTLSVLFSKEATLQSILYSILPLFIVLLPGMCTLGISANDDRSVQKRMSLARLILRSLQSGKKDWLNKGSTTGDTVRRKELKKLRLKPKLNLVFDLYA